MMTTQHNAHQVALIFCKPHENPLYSATEVYFGKL